MKRIKPTNMPQQASATLEIPVANCMTNITCPRGDNKNNPCGDKYNIDCSANESNIECIDNLTLTDIKIRCKDKKLRQKPFAISKHDRNCSRALPSPTQKEYDAQGHIGFKLKERKSYDPEPKQMDHTQFYAETIKISEGAGPFRPRIAVSGTGHLNSNGNADYMIHGKPSNVDTSFSPSDFKKENLYNGRSIHSAKTRTVKFSHCAQRCFASECINNTDLSKSNLLDTSAEVPSEENGALVNGRSCNFIEETEDCPDDALTSIFLQQKNRSHPTATCVTNSIPYFNFYETFQTKQGQTCSGECEKEMPLSDSIDTHCSVNDASAEIAMSGKVKAHSESDKSHGCLNIAGTSGISSPQNSTLLTSNENTCSPHNKESPSGKFNSSDISYNIYHDNISLEKMPQEKFIQRNNFLVDNHKSFSLKDYKGEISGETDCGRSCSLLDKEDIINQINKEVIEHQEDPFDVHCNPCSTVLNDSGDQMNVQDMCIANGEKHVIHFIGENSPVKNDGLNNGQQVTGASKVITASIMEDELSYKSQKSLSTYMDEMLSSQTEESDSINADEPTVTKSTEKPSFAMDESSSPLPEASSSSVSLECSNGGGNAKGSKTREDLKEARSPKKLLSTRLTISPGSQEKLCRALNGINLHATLPYSANRKRLLFENFKEPELPSLLYSKDPEILGYEKKAKRPKNCQNGLTKVHTKGILKSPDAPSKKYASNNSSLIHKQTQEAVTFLERQMSDFESVASKLLNGVKSLINIVEETFLTEAPVSTSSNFTVDKIQETVRNTSKLEPTTNRWLSILRKDTTRFCKIMRAREREASDDIGNAVQKGRKITFADEAGGVLCHVKVLEPHPDSSCESQEEKGKINIEGCYPTS